MNLTIEHRTVNCHKNPDGTGGVFRHEQYEVCTKDACIAIFFNERMAQEYLVMRKARAELATLRDELATAKTRIAELSINYQKRYFPVDGEIVEGGRMKHCNVWILRCRGLKFEIKNWVDGLTNTCWSYYVNIPLRALDNYSMGWFDSCYWHNRVSFYERHRVNNYEFVKVGCDYQHPFDSEHTDIDCVLRDIDATARSIHAVIAPKLWCQGCSTIESPHTTECTDYYCERCIALRKDSK